jgi:glycosyltransferase involved in cell wall biosynthesis
VPLGIYRRCSDGLSAQTDAGPIVLFFGRLSPYKGLEVLYEAAPRVAERVPGVRFIVAGRPVHGYEPPVPPSLPNGGRIDVYAQYIPNDAARALFESARLVACPYVDATQSGVILTAYGFGKPVVATTVGGIPEYVRDGETGVLVQPRNATALAAALVTVLTDEQLRRALGGGIEKLADGPLSWSNTAERLISVYKHAASDRSAH